MNKNVIYIILGVLTLGATVAMYVIGSDSTHLSELKDYFWVPIPLGFILLALGFKKA